ncbi:hypothetical protein Syn7502_02846 [Synechococcus sp. PCC 7502]|uniref:hypothetical protein n=1 Tax=Synechococcus sp. PCC 7502 TaxID=1173263 RepID=UPI00029FB9CF|nr:hypothetical protein [Synechococcus sp. PCC 7502]AFY74783.1 hypothetical protein Syn7502_02846 [Synechococcus sp. PCC 7502]
MTFDPRKLGTSVYDSLVNLRGGRDKNDPIVKKQKSQAQELYTYLSTWGLMRLKAEEIALGTDGREQSVKAFFRCLEDISGKQNLANNQGLSTLKALTVDEYLGITGLGLAIAQEFSFWTTAIYYDVSGDD